MKEVSLYIHIPFCKQKCLYCDFPSFCGKEKYMSEYIDCLARELELLPDVEFSTIFIGGGTPTYLNLAELNKLKIAIDKLQKREDVEFTVECNPGTVTYEKLRALKAMGVNRLSIGLQAWQDELLKKLGRIHNIEEFIETFCMARQHGFNNINVDIMFGLPGQALNDLKETINNICSMEPEHISCYSLIIEEGTAFEKMYEKDIITLPGEEVERQMYELIKDELMKKGYHQYEISNFSKDGKECRHNLVYWQLGEYIGCGSGAHSFFCGKRYNNAEEIEKYIEMMKYKQSAIVTEYVNAKEDSIEEFMFMGLRTIKGISTEEFQQRFSMNINYLYGKIINKYISLDLLRVDDGRLYLTDKGIEISNTIMAEFILDKK